MDWESLTVGTSPDFLDLIERSRRNYKKHGGHSIEEVRRELGLPPFDPDKAKADRRKPKTKAHASTGARKPKAKN
jgi:hypothetical protein